MFAIVVGAAIALDSLWQFAALVAFYVMIRWGVVAREEAYLAPQVRRGVSCQRRQALVRAHAAARPRGRQAGWPRAVIARPAAHSGMLSCFFQGFSSFLLRSIASTRDRRRRVECGMITSSI